jgi:NAD dependent epimerase/dehydratase
MKILVTGADGFIGSHLTELLLNQGHQVRALVQYNSFNNWGWLESFNHPNLEIRTGDIRDPFFCQELAIGIDQIFHLAALIAIPYSYVAPQSYIDTNVTGTLNICEAAKKAKVKRLLVTSTSEVYGTAQYVPIDEKHPKQPQSPYSASKIGADMVALSYANSFDLPVTIVRPFNTYGPRQSARAIIPTMITQIAAGYDTIQVGDLSPTRDFNYVEDTCKGFIAISNSDATIGKEINIASNTEISIGETLELIKNLMNSDVQFITSEERIRPTNSEVFRLFGDNTLIRELTEFVPANSIELGLQKTIDWFMRKDNLSKYKPGIYNI